jgi:YhcH/YjgK/YiaL family protein
MILDTLQNRHLYRGLGARFELSFNAVVDGIGKRADGTYDLDGSNVRAIVQRYPSKPIEQCMWEAHRNYIDIQFIESGAESIGWAPIESLKSREPYSAERDVEFFDGNGGETFTLRAGMFAIFFPTDAHRPCIQIDHPTEVAKVVFKIAVT